METLNFSLQEGERLTKEQMKRINGGYIGCGVTGYGGQDLGYALCYGDACSCQDSLDAACETSDNCDDIDCGCK